MNTITTPPGDPVFKLSSTITVSFTNAQLLEIALLTLADWGHEFDTDTLESNFSADGLTIQAETITSKPAKAATKKPATRRKRRTKKQIAKDEAAAKAKEAEENTESVAEDATPKVTTGNNPFQATSSPVEETIAAVKNEAGVPEVAPFSTETADIIESDAGEAPPAKAEDSPFVFADIGKN